MSLLVVTIRQFHNSKRQILSTLPPTTSTISLCIPQTHIFLCTYTAKKPVKTGKLSAPIYAQKELEDGSVFISRVTLSPQKISPDELPTTLKPIKQKSYNLTKEQKKKIKKLKNKIFKKI